MVDNILKYLHYIVLFYGLNQLYTTFDENITNVELKQGEVESVAVEYENKVSELKRLDRDKGEIDNFKNKIDLLEEQIATVKRKLVTDAEQTSVLQDLSNEASNLNIKEVAFNPKPKRSMDVYFINSLEMKGVATYLQMLIFFEHLMQTDRIYNISRVKVVNSKEEVNKGRFNFISTETIIETYQYNEAYQDPASKAAAVPAPAAAPPPAANSRGGSDD